MSFQQRRPQKGKVDQVFERSVPLYPCLNYTTFTFLFVHWKISLRFYLENRFYYLKKMLTLAI